MITAKTPEMIIHKYQKMRDNVRWHLETNKPTDKMEVQKCNQQIEDYEEVIRDLTTVAESYHASIQLPVGERPLIKDFFGEDANLQIVMKIYEDQPELFKYAQALDNYIDELLAHPPSLSVSVGEAVEFAEWLLENGWQSININVGLTNALTKCVWSSKWGKGEKTSQDLYKLFQHSNQ